jgi:hypothetical protein
VSSRAVKTFGATLAAAVWAGCAQSASPSLPQSGVRASRVIVDPDLRIHPRVLHLDVDEPSGKTEIVYGYEPNGSYHDTCEGLGIATIGPERRKERTAYFDIAPTHQGRCVIQFLHAAPSGVKERTLSVVVRASPREARR